MNVEKKYIKIICDELNWVWLHKYITDVFMERLLLMCVWSPESESAFGIKRLSDTEELTARAERLTVTEGSLLSAPVMRMFLYNKECVVVQCAIYQFLHSF